jgi:flagellar biosynthesis/type III secretory pathway protein FliH
LAQYRQQRDQLQRVEIQRRSLLERQRRTAQLRYQQRYLEQVRQDQLRLQNWQYSYAAPQYRYSRGGRYYQVNQYAADMLRTAVRDGYAEGFRAGQSDREDRWRSNYQDSYAYQDSSYGYNGYYVGLSDYRYYFREGFRRGYEDGFYNRYRYGSNSNGAFSILSGVLQTILNLQNL